MNIGKWFQIIICGWLLSICLFAITVLTVWNLIDYWRAADWITVQGKIIDLKTVNYGERKPAERRSVPDKLVCQYAYEFDGKNYSGNRIGVETFAEKSGRGRRYRQLKAQFEEVKPIPVLVNPNAPGESALFREILPSMYCGPALGAFWFTMLLIQWRLQHRKARHDP